MELLILNGGHWSAYRIHMDEEFEYPTTKVKNYKKRSRFLQDKEKRSGEKRIKKASPDYKRQKLIPRNIIMNMDD